MMTQLRVNTARKGPDFEREIKAPFESAGYSVIRGAGSKGDVFGMKADLVATKGDKTAAMVIIQCKNHRKVKTAAAHLCFFCGHRWSIPPGPRACPQCAIARIERDAELGNNGARSPPP
jgi:hypothetical protein